MISSFIRLLLIGNTIFAHAAAGDFMLSAAKPLIASAALTEASGLAVSPKNNQFLWAINDSGGTTDLHLFRTDGSDSGKVTLINSKNTDWEDLASFTLDGKAYLLIADTGDNRGSRNSCTLYILPEPALPATGGKLSGTATSAWSLEFTYEGGPRDCEAVAVDSSRQKIILVSKRTIPPEIFELPLRASANPESLMAKKVGMTDTNSPAARFIPFANQPVGMDFSEDGSLAAILTYYSVFLFQRNSKETWAEAFAKKPRILAPHGLPQAESLAFSRDGQQIHLISEGQNQPIITYQR